MLSLQSVAPENWLARYFRFEEYDSVDVDIVSRPGLKSKSMEGGCALSDLACILSFLRRRCGVQLHSLGFALTAEARSGRAVTPSIQFEMGRPASAGWQRALRGRRPGRSVKDELKELHFDELVYDVED